MISRTEFDAATAVVRSVVPPTPQYCWPLLARRLGTELWVKHENHTPIGAFKLRGGLVYLDHVRRTQPEVMGVISATRGNHGQSIACAAARLGMTATLVVPHGNSTEKNRSMRAYGAELVEVGHDFQAAYEYAIGRAEAERLHLVPTFHPKLVQGVGTYGVELFEAVPDLDVVYVPIGQGSGICGMIAARDATGAKAEIVGVVAENAACYALSLAAGHAVSTNTADTIADGLACRVPDEAALAIVRKGVAHITTVSEAEIRQAMRTLYSDTHNVAEGAGAAAFAAACKERHRLAGRKVAVVLSGGNVDRSVFAEVLAEPDME
ncbi:MAG: threonine dehydratase [Alphaproteobacteria bacterium]|nr:threonine dehydratase [Alphaproteobacteria bacterium]